MFKIISQTRRLDVQFEGTKPNPPGHVLPGLKGLVSILAIIGMFLALPADAQTGLPIINMIDDGSGVPNTV